MWNPDPPNPAAAGIFRSLGRCGPASTRGPGRDTPKIARQFTAGFKVGYAQVPQGLNDASLEATNLRRNPDDGYTVSRIYNARPGGETPPSGAGEDARRYMSGENARRYLEFNVDVAE